MPDWAQEQIARELVEDFDKGYNPSEYKDITISLVEYDPNQSEDFSVLTELLQEKIANEGNPLLEDLEHYEKNLEELISFPILIFNGNCVEGRHRMTVALFHLAKIRAYCF